MKVPDLSQIDSLEKKLENLLLVVRKTKQDGYQINRGNMIMFVSALNLLNVEISVNLQLLLQTQFREEDKHG